MIIMKPCLAIKIDKPIDLQAIRNILSEDDNIKRQADDTFTYDKGHVIIYRNSADPKNIWYDYGYAPSTYNIDLSNVKTRSVSDFYGLFVVNNRDVIRTVEIISPLTYEELRGKEKMEIIVYTNAGATYKFENVSNFQYTTNGFKFEYVGASTGVKRTIEFNNTSTAGFAKS